MNKKTWITVIIVFVLAGITGGYVLLKKGVPWKKPLVTTASSKTTEEEEGPLSVLRIYYPSDGLLTMVEKKLPARSKQTAIAEAVIEEFFKGPGGKHQSSIPRNVRLLGIYRDQVQILYIDLSDEFRRNFQGDALSEYLVLKGLYESITANVQEFQDIKVLVEGKEIESVGGHFYLKYPLKSSVLYEYRGDDKVSHEQD